MWFPLDAFQAFSSPSVASNPSLAAPFALHEVFNVIASFYLLTQSIFVFFH